MLKRIVALLVMVALCMSTVPLSSAATPNKPSSGATADIKAAIERGIVPERIQSNYQQPITREEFCELLVRRLLIIKNPVELVYYEDTDKGYYNGLVTPEAITKAIKCPNFEDTDSLYVKTAYIFGIVNDEKTFKPNEKILRQDAAVMLANYLQATASTYGLYYTEEQYMRNGKSSNKDIAEVKYKDFKKISAYAIEAVDVCYGNKIMIDYGSLFKPMAYYTREQAIVTINKLISEAENIILLRGRVRIGYNTLSMGWEVGSDFVALNPISKLGPCYEEIYRFNWYDRYRGGSAETDDQVYEPDWNQFCIAMINDLGVGKKGYYMARMKKHSKWDYGHMIVTTYNKDSLIKYTFKPIKGYIEFGLYGSTYGRNLTDVEPKQIE